MDGQDGQGCFWVVGNWPVARPLRAYPARIASLARDDVIRFLGDDSLDRGNDWGRANAAIAVYFGG